MLGLVLPNSKSVLLKTFTFKNCKELYDIRDNKSAVIEFIDELFITQGLNIIEKFYCLLHIRDLCIGNIIELRDYNFDVLRIQEELQEIVDIKKIIKFDSNSITFNYPKNFTCSSIDNDGFIETIFLEGEVIDYNKLSSEERNLIFNYLPESIQTEIKNFYNTHINRLKIEFTLKDKNLAINLDRLQCVEFLTTMLGPINPGIHRDYIFILSKRIKDVSFIQQSTYLDVKDYMDLYVKEAKENKSDLNN
tara:strand:- start:2546 stop:3292 length:747 start_codon:yes stop_codon:yes gene_type:complete